MPDVMNESARTSYDDAAEVFSESGDVVGVATFAADQDWHGVPTGARDTLPIRVYVLDVEGDIAGEAGASMTAWLDLGAACELVELLDAAIAQVELTCDRRRRHPLSARSRSMRRA